MSDDSTKLNLKSARARIVAASTLVGAALFLWFAVSWQVGSMLAAYTPATDPTARALAETAHALSPGDPATNWFLADVQRESYLPEDLSASIANLQRAARLAPYDYRVWIELGRGYERADRDADAEAAFARAVELAPSYANVAWQIGNFHLRRGHEPQAFAALRRSAELSATYGEQVFAVLWEFYDKDKSKLETVAGERPELLASLARFYASRGLAPDSLRVWNKVPATEKLGYSAIAKLIARVLYDKQNYRSAVEFVRETGIEPDAQAGALLNGGFEQPIASDAAEVYFGWRVTKKEKLDVGPDSSKKKEGSRSLRMTFAGFAARELGNVAEVVAVDQGRRYRLGFWFRTAGLKSAGNPTVEVVSAIDLKVLATSAPMPSGTQEWTQAFVEFSPPPGIEAIVVRVERSYCGENCPIVGSLWLDDFNLEAR